MGLPMLMQIPRKSANASYSVSGIPKNGETSVFLVRTLQITGSKQ